MSSIFKSKDLADKQKLRGGYYTPTALADYLCHWALRGSNETILEPSCGDGNFVESSLKIANIKKITPKITAVEIDNEEISKAKERCGNKGISWINDDFFRAYTGIKKKKFDVILGNPPFIRFQYFDDESRNIAFSHLRDIGYKPTKLANSWAAFVQLSIEMLKDGGRLAMVIPAELLQVKYAGELRERIVKHFDHVVLVAFKKLVFPDIQQEVVLLLAEGKHKREGDVCDVHTIQVHDASELKPDVLQYTVAHSEAKHTRPGMKWTSFFLKEESFEILEKVQRHPKLIHLGDIASVNVGIVTGRNKFFVVDEEVKNQYDLEKFCIPIVGRTSAVNSLNFNEMKLDECRLKYPSNLLNLTGFPEEEFSTGLKSYIQFGEEEGVNQGYKCRVRPKWYEVPSVYISDGFLFRQIYKHPLLVVNEIGAACTDTIHRVKLLQDIDFKQVSASFVNSLTFAWSEICGRSYGGGVLELEPRESEELPIPFNQDICLDTDLVNEFLNKGDVYAALNYVDKILLIDHLGLTQKHVNHIREAWESLRDRRLNRK